MSSIYLGLVHFPIKNKQGEIVTTSVTNLDIHDISRSCRTYGIKSYFIITPILAQHDLVNKIIGHWHEEKANIYNPDRAMALKNTVLVKSIEHAHEKILETEGQAPFVTVTGANFQEDDGTEIDLVRKIKIDSRPLFILFGTGWGLSNHVVEQADFRLKPLKGQAKDGYNHLSVRSAVAIYLERLRHSL